MRMFALYSNVYITLLNLYLKNGFRGYPFRKILSCYNVS